MLHNKLSNTRENFRAHQSNSGYWNGAMNAPLAASTWIFMSHLFAVFSLPAACTIHCPTYGECPEMQFYPL